MDKKVVLITGASTGIGEATAIRLNNAGYIVYGAARRVEKMKNLQALGVRVLKMDVTNDPDLITGVETIIKEQGRIDVLVNNAGYGSYGSLEDVPLHEGRSQFEVNFFGLARMSQLVIPHMREQKSGYIINISSIGGKIYEPCGSWYHSTKFAVEGMSDCLRLELKDFGIRVVIIEPGATTSEWNKIARKNLLKLSGNTAYREIAMRVHKLLEMGEKYTSPADSAARQIEKALLSRKPRARYTSGKGAGFMVFMRNILPDRAFDSLMGVVIR